MAPYNNKISLFCQEYKMELLMSIMLCSNSQSGYLGRTRFQALLPSQAFIHRYALYIFVFVCFIYIRVLNNIRDAKRTYEEGITQGVSL